MIMTHSNGAGLDVESFLPMRWRRLIFRALQFDSPLPFSRSDMVSLHTRFYSRCVCVCVCVCV